MPPKRIYYIFFGNKINFEKISEELLLNQPRNTKFRALVYAIIKVTSSFNSNGTSCSKKTTFLSKQLLLNNDFLYNKTVSRRPLTFRCPLLTDVDIIKYFILFSFF
jgi:hypothetical protein